MKKIVLLTALLCLLIAFQSVFGDWTAPQKKEDLVYDGTDQHLLTDPIPASSDQKFFYRNPWTGKWDETIPSGHFPGRYSVEWTYIDGSQTRPSEDKKGWVIDNIYIKEKDQPLARTDIIWDAGKSYLIDPDFEKVRYNNGDKSEDRFYFRSNSSESWNKNVPTAIGPGIYKAQYILWYTSEIPDKSMEGFTISDIEIRSNSTDAPKVSGPKYPDKNKPAMVYYPYYSGRHTRPINPSGNNGSSSNHYSFYTIGDGSALFGSNQILPATGFPTRISKPLSIKPENVFYEDLSMRIQIPSINVDVELTGVPEYENTWAVEWLDNQAGILSGSAMPGDGYTLVAAHNHLNTQEIGPFAFLFDLKENDRIFVNMPDDGLKMYSVYANELLEPNDFRQMAAISEGEEGSLILITCENEMTDGGYQNRRVVFAKLMN